MENTRRLTTLDLDLHLLAEDMTRADRFRYSDAYNEFTCGSWKGSALCNNTGDIFDARIVDYDGPYKVTEHGRQMPYVLDLIGRFFNLEHLKFARLGRMTPWSVLIPHRDYLELKASLTRIHIPLHTSSDCYSSENDTIYQMRQGEVWFIDATQIHSAVSFFHEDRTHLILDFATPDVQSAIAFVPETRKGILDEETVERRAFQTADIDALQSLSAIISTYNYRDVLALVIKQYFVSQLPVSEIFDIVCDIAKTGGQTEALERLEWLKTHTLVARLDEQEAS